MPSSFFIRRIYPWVELLRWQKPSGRLILLIPAGWSLWLAPGAPPETSTIALILLGGLATSGAGCIVNDLWDRRVDCKVERTCQRPLARGALRPLDAVALLLVLLIVALTVISALPESGRLLSLLLAITALPLILLYPSAKRWFALPQLLLSLCWGFAVLIPWAATQGSLNGGWPLLGCWLSVLIWTFCFDTVYAMADRYDDARLSLRSSALSLGPWTLLVVAIGYGITTTLLASAAVAAGIQPTFWPFWLVATAGMQSATTALRGANVSAMDFSCHFGQQVWFGALLLLGLVVGRST